MTQARKIPREFYAAPGDRAASEEIPAGGTLSIARDLIGMHLVHNDAGTLRVGRIVETEAYMGPRDLAAHSAKGRTARTEVMFGPPGHAYVYFIYGFWYCLNIVTAPEGVPHAVLLRALEPVAGLEDKTWGPGLLCRAMNINKRLNGTDLLGDELWLERPPRGSPRPHVSRATRIGVDYAGEWAQRPWRFFDRDSPYVSTGRRTGVPPRKRPPLNGRAGKMGSTAE